MYIVIVIKEISTDFYLVLNYIETSLTNLERYTLVGMLLESNKLQDDRLTQYILGVELQRKCQLKNLSAFLLNGEYSMLLIRGSSKIL